MKNQFTFANPNKIKAFRVFEFACVSNFLSIIYSMLTTLLMCLRAQHDRFLKSFIDKGLNTHLPREIPANTFLNDGIYFLP